MSLPSHLLKHEQVILTYFENAARNGEASCTFSEAKSAKSKRAQVYALVRKLRTELKQGTDWYKQLRMMQEVSLYIEHERTLVFRRKDLDPVNAEFERGATIAGLMPSEVKTLEGELKESAGRLWDKIEAEGLAEPEQAVRPPKSQPPDDNRALPMGSPSPRPQSPSPASASEEGLTPTEFAQVRAAEAKLLSPEDRARALNKYLGGGV